MIRRIPYGAVVSPGIELFEDGSPGSPQVIVGLNVRLARGGWIDEGPGTGENGTLYLIEDDGSPAQLVFNAATASPDKVFLWTGLDTAASPSNWAGKRVNILHYHNTGRPIFFQIENTATQNVLAWGVLEPLTTTVPLSEVP